MRSSSGPDADRERVHFKILCDGPAEPTALRLGSQHPGAGALRGVPRETDPGRRPRSAPRPPEENAPAPSRSARTPVPPGAAR
ncbi:hypothetical protein HMPREF1550_02252 [Actinomyces sp. oral taxon 877 str. F0543]|nr:hypothetical protein HMPREF1550_02252 [Actinomyces sp. oral taxon 877 str. F0543]